MANDAGLEVDRAGVGVGVLDHLGQHLAVEVGAVVVAPAIRDATTVAHADAVHR